MTVKELIVSNKLIRIFDFEELESTNKYLKENSEKYNDFDVVITKKQTAGYGRRGRTWLDNGGLFMSVIIKNINQNEIHKIPHCVAVSIVRFLDKIGVDSMIKWPNDIIVNERKISGVLVESSFTDKVDYVVIGIGLNLKKSTFEKSCALEEFVAPVDRIDVVNGLLEELVENITNLEKKDAEILRFINDRSYLKDKMIKINNEDYNFLEIGSNYELVVEKNGIKKFFRDSEVTLESIYKKSAE